MGARAFADTSSKPSLGRSAGGGVEMAIGRGRAFAEVRAHDLLESGGMAGALPLTPGVRF